MFGSGFHPTYNMKPVAPSSAEEQGLELHAAADTEATSSPLNPDDYDFSCMRQTDTSPPEWKMTYYKFSRVDVQRRDESSLRAPMEFGTDPSDLTQAALPEFNLYNALRLFYANGGGTCYIVSVGSYWGDDDKPVKVTYPMLKKGLDAAREQSGPTMLVIPDAVLLQGTSAADVPTSDDFYTLCRDMMQQSADLQDRVAILDVYGADSLNQGTTGWELAMDKLIENFQAGMHETNLKYGMAYFPFLVTSIVRPEEIDYTNVNIDDPDQCKLLQGILYDQVEFLYPGPSNARKRETINGYIDDIATVTTDPAAITRLNQNLVNAIPLLQQMENIMAMMMSLLPPSGAMAGVYTFIDGTRGVWNAPANVTLSSVLAPNVKLNNEQQGNLNVPINGKAINAIRQFVGRGPVVWARARSTATARIGATSRCGAR
jgi:hypothetical protein